MTDFVYEDVAKMIDHSLLVPTMSEADLQQGIQLALAYDVASICIMPYYLRRCADALADSTIKASTTIGFPHGGHTTEIKQAEAKQAIADGGEELDMVINIGDGAVGQFVGLDPAKDAEILDLHAYVGQGEWLSDEDPLGVVIGTRLARPRWERG